MDDIQILWQGALSSRGQVAKMLYLAGLITHALMHTLPTSPAYRFLGFVHRPRGMEGWLGLGLPYPGLCLPKGSWIYLYRHKTFVPYKLQAWEPDEWYASFLLEGITNRTEAEGLKGLPAYCLVEGFPPAPQPDHLAPLQLLGYEVEDHQLGALGAVVEIDFQGGQSRLEVEKAGRRLLIPFHEALVREVAHAAKRVYTVLPEGYTEQG